MRRRFLEALICTGLLCMCASHALAQDAKQDAQAPENTLGPWRLTNTLIFAVIAGYFIYRYAPGFFNARTTDIEKAIKDATGLKLDADFRYSEADRKMASLAQEVQRLRAEYGQELEREHERLKHETELQIGRLQQNVSNEIDAFRKDGMRQVRQKIAQAALLRAEERLREHAGDTEPENLVQDFVHVVERGAK